MFWLSIVLATIIGGFALFNITVGLGLQFIALVLAGNAFVRLQRGKPAKNRINVGATRFALIVSGVGIALGLYRVAVGA
ncbi:hypothetical protein [Lysobacter sp. P5_B9]